MGVSLALAGKRHSLSPGISKPIGCMQRATVTVFACLLVWLLAWLLVWLLENETLKEKNGTTRGKEALS